MTFTICKFTIDGLFAGTFTHWPRNDSTELLYNQTVFSKEGLTNSQHVLTMSVSEADAPNGAFLNFDYALYT